MKPVKMSKMIVSNRHYPVVNGKVMIQTKREELLEKWTAIGVWGRGHHLEFCPREEL